MDGSHSSTSRAGVPRCREVPVLWQQFGRREVFSCERPAPARSSLPVTGVPHRRP